MRARVIHTSMGTVRRVMTRRSWCPAPDRMRDSNPISPPSSLVNARTLERSNERTNERTEFVARRPDPTRLAREEDDVARDAAMRDAIERRRGRATGFDAIEKRDANGDDDATKGANAHGD